MPIPSLRPGGIAVLLTLALALAGCASYEAARLYKSGTAALDRGESERAISDLERAAVTPIGSPHPGTIALVKTEIRVLNQAGVEQVGVCAAGYGGRHLQAVQFRGDFSEVADRRERPFAV